MEFDVDGVQEFETNGGGTTKKLDNTSEAIHDEVDSVM